MSNLITSIIYAVMGAVIIAASIITKANWEVLCLGIVVTGFSLGLIVAEIVKKNKKN